MSYPGFVRRLFASNGAGPCLRPDILPEAPIVLESAGTEGAATVTLDGGLGRVFAVSVAAPMTVAAANVPFGACLLLLITNGGSQPVTWGMAPRWANGVPPLLAADGTDLVSLLRGPDGWYGVHVAAHCA